MKRLQNKKLTTEIPEFRLPRSVLKTEIENLKHCGIKIITNKSIDKDFSIDQIFELNYQAIVIGIGSQKAKLLKLPGEDSRIVLQALKMRK